MMKEKILVIEDEKVLLDVLKKKLTNMGYEVDTAEDGRIGLEKIESFQPDLILLDMLLPEVDGMEVLETMKKKGVTIPVVVVSNSGQPVDIDRALALGAIDYLVKADLRIDEVAAKVVRCLGNEAREEDQNSDKSGSKEKVLLLVEDDLFLQSLCVRKATTMGYQVEVAADGDDAIKKVILLRPALVLLDLVIPGRDGYEVLKEIRQHDDKGIAGTPVVVLSNLGQKESIDKAMGLGANDFMVKANFTPDDVMEKVKEYMG